MMTDTTTGTTDAAATAAATEAAAAAEKAASDKAAADAAAATDKVEGEDALGDAGTKALATMKAERKAAKDEAASAKAALAAMQAKLDGKEAEHEATQAAQKVQDDALATANTRILKAEVRAAGASKLQDPKDALLHIDLSEFEVNSDGEVDSSAITQAIDDLIARKPYLAAQSGTKFQGSADGGARNGSTPDLHAQIAAATKARDFTTAIALKQQLAASLKKS